MSDDEFSIFLFVLGTSGRVSFAAFLQESADARAGKADSLIVSSLRVGVRFKFAVSNN